MFSLSKKSVDLRGLFPIIINMGWIILSLVLLNGVEGDSIFDISADASLSGALAYNYVDPNLYIMNYDYLNPAAAGMRAAFVNPASLATIPTASATISAGFGRSGAWTLNFDTEIPYVGRFDLPVAFYSVEHSGVYMGAAAVRLGDVVMGFAYLEGDRFSGAFDVRGEVGFTATYSFADTLTNLDVPGLSELDTIPIIIDLFGEGGGLLSVEGEAKLRSTPFYLILATEDNGINYGMSFRFNVFSGFIDYTDTLTPVLEPSGANVFSQSTEWDVGVELSTVIEGAELYSNHYVSSLTGTELGAVLGISQQKEAFNWGVSVEQNLGAQIFKITDALSTRGGLPRIVKLNTQDLVVDTDARRIKGEMEVVMGYEGLRTSQKEAREVLALAPRTGIRAGIQAAPGDWMIDATLATARTWGSGITEFFWGTGFGYNIGNDYKVPVRFSQAIFYRVTKIEEFPLYSIPGLFFGLSTTFHYKGIELDLSVRANTTTAILGTYAAALDPNTPDLGIFNYLSAGAALNYAF